MLLERAKRSPKSRTHRRAASASGEHRSPSFAGKARKLLTNEIEIDLGRYRGKRAVLIFAICALVALLAAFVLSSAFGSFQLFAVLLLAISIPISAILTTKTFQVAHMERLLKGYLSKDITRQAVREQAHDNDVRTVYATVLFADIRSFTQMTETCNTLDLFRELNAYYEVVDAAVSAFGGTVNKFGGDSVLALFGATQPHPDHGTAALNAAAAIVDGLAELNQSRMARNRAPFRIGIGVQTGDMVVGHLGSSQRREYTVLGDCVNVAKRLSDLSKESPFYSIFVGDATLDCVKHMPTSLVVDELGDTTVRGRHATIKTYAVTPLISRSRVLPGGYAK